MRPAQLDELRAVIQQKGAPVDLQAEMLKKLGDISKMEVFHHNVLCMVYVQEKFGSLYRPDQSKAEDLYQGKVGLVVAMGPDAFKNDDRWRWEKPIQVGDWLMFRPSDALLMKVNGQECRMLADTDVKMRVGAPEMIW